MKPPWSTSSRPGTPLEMRDWGEEELFVFMGSSFRWKAPSSEIVKFCRKGENLITIQTEQKFNSGHSRKFSGSTRRKPAHFIQLDSRQHADFTPKRLGVRLFCKKYLVWNFDCDLLESHISTPSIHR
jgi:hypothetical protein